MHTRRVAVIDVGTNSVRLLLADVRSDGTVKTLSRVGSVTRLGEGAGASGMIAPLPEAAGQVAPPEPVQVQVALLIPAGSGEVTLAPVTSLGPLLEATTE